MKRLYYLLFLLLPLQACQKSDVGLSNNAGGTTGQGGSLARFTIARNHLFVVDNRKLYSYSLSNSAEPILKSTQDIGFNIETIYTYEDKLFIGSQNAMYIYSIANPAQPAQLSQASHVRACDPVVANDSLAYVTVRSGSSCGGAVNALLIYDVRNILNPIQLNTVPLSNPWGLGIHNKKLYVCDASQGLVVFDLTDPIRPQEVQRITGEAFYDVIATDDLLIAMVQNGSILYSYQTNDTLALASRMPN
jgi:hypothetical protein